MAPHLTLDRTPISYNILKPMRECADWSVEILEIRYMPELDAPADRPHPFLYSIRIVNHSHETITLRGRKWIVREDDGSIRVVEGEGVVGECPVFSHGDSFEYKSYHVVAHNASVQGAYFGHNNNGETLFTRIPDFRLIIQA